MKNIAVIPARGGSKGLKDKNIKELCGKPLLAYSVEAALQSGIFDTVHVSTDSVHYQEIARMYGADVPFFEECADVIGYGIYMGCHAVCAGGIPKMGGRV